MRKKPKTKKELLGEIAGLGKRLEAAEQRSEKAENNRVGRDTQKKHSCNQKLGVRR